MIPKCSICKKEECDELKHLLKSHEPYLGQFCSSIICANACPCYKINDKEYVRILSDKGYEEDIAL